MFSGKVDIDEVAQRLDVADRARRVRDGRRLLSWRISAACPPSASGSTIDGLARRSARRGAAADQQGAHHEPAAEADRDAGEESRDADEIRIRLVHRPAQRGKSTLLNRLVGTKLAIVSDKPQTTRTRILGVRNYPDAQVVFLDTPGIHRPLHRMNVRMVDAARRDDARGRRRSAWSSTWRSRRARATAIVLDLVKNVEAPVFLILNKIDLDQEVEAAAADRQSTASEAAFAEIVPVSAATGDNVDRLERAIIDRLPEGRARCTRTIT